VNNVVECEGMGCNGMLFNKQGQIVETTVQLYIRAYNPRNARDF
jgi:hypothetical protein